MITEKMIQLLVTNNAYEKPSDINFPLRSISINRPIIAHQMKPTILRMVNSVSIFLVPDKDANHHGFPFSSRKLIPLIRLYSRRLNR